MYAIIQNNHTVATLVMLVQDPAMKRSCSATLRYPAYLVCKYHVYSYVFLNLTSSKFFCGDHKNCNGKWTLPGRPYNKNEQYILCYPEQLATISFEVQLK